MVDLDESAQRSACNDPVYAAADHVRQVARSGSAEARSATLARVIEADIIPRLLLTRTGREQDRRPSPVALDVDADDIDDFARMMIRLDVARARAIVSTALARGVMLESILLGLFAPTAQRLGVMWEDDDCTFTDVTVGLCTLQSLLRSYASGDALDHALIKDGRVLIAATPGEQHTFGVLMLETFFRRAGWDVVGLPLATEEEVLASVSRRAFRLVGFSLSREDALDRLRDLIAKVRGRAIGDGLTVLVGGRVFNENPSLVREVGADITAADGHLAVVASQHVLCSTVQLH